MPVKTRLHGGRRHLVGGNKVGKWFKGAFKKVKNFVTSDPVKGAIGQVARHVIGNSPFSGAAPLADAGLKAIGMGRRRRVSRGRGRASLAGSGRKSLAGAGRKYRVTVKAHVRRRPRKPSTKRHIRFH